MKKQNKTSKFEIIKNIISVILILLLGIVIFRIAKKAVSQNLKSNIILFLQIICIFIATFICYKPIRRIFKPKKVNSSLICIFIALGLFSFEFDGALKITRHFTQGNSLPKIWFVYVIVLCLIVITMLAERHSKFTLQQLDSMEGHDFEFACSEILKDNKFKKVRVTQGSGDFGIDILAEKDGIKYAVQCKCYSRKLDNKAIQEAHTGMAFYECDRCAVMTNQYFTEPAKKLANTIDAELWDRDALGKMLSHKHRYTENSNVIEETYEAEDEIDTVTDEE